MAHPHAARTVLVAPPLDAAKVLRCAQCGEVLDAQRMLQLTARIEKPLCADCSFDLPCTD